MTGGRDMAAPSACPCGPSPGLHPRAPCALLYPSLCQMSSPSRHTAPRSVVLLAALVRMLGGTLECA